MLADAILIPPRSPIQPTNQKKVRVREKSTETSNRIITKFVSICRYSHEVRAFGTLIMSTQLKVWCTAYTHGGTTNWSKNVYSKGVYAPSMV